MQHAENVKSDPPSAPSALSSTCSGGPVCLFTDLQRFKIRDPIVSQNRVVLCRQQQQAFEYATCVSATQVANMSAVCEQCRRECHAGNAEGNPGYRAEDTDCTPPIECSAPRQRRSQDSFRGVGWRAASPTKQPRYAAIRVVHHAVRPT